MKPSKLATKRTKERFIQHFPFEEIKRERIDGFGGGDVWVLLKSSKTNYLGWIPIEEIDFS